MAREWPGQSDGRLPAAGLSTDTSKPNSTALSDSDVSLKLNKRDGQPIFSFEIRGRVRQLSFHTSNPGEADGRQ